MPRVFERHSPPTMPLASMRRRRLHVDSGPPDVRPMPAKQEGGDGAEGGGGGGGGRQGRRRRAGTEKASIGGAPLSVRDSHMRLVPLQRNSPRQPLSTHMMPSPSHPKLLPSRQPALLSCRVRVT